MARLSATFFSGALGTTTHAEIIFPMRIPLEVPPTRVLYLLHGMRGGCTNWLEDTRISHYANLHNYIVVMPEVQNSFYTDMAYGANYFTYAAHELPQLVEHMLNVKHSSENTFVAGFSMGGYGALRIALNRPDFFAAAAAFGGALDAQGIFKTLPTMDEASRKIAVSIAGEGLQVPEGGDLFSLASAVGNAPAKPRIFVTCGESDFLLEANRAFAKHIQALPFDFEYKEWAGEHTWCFCEESLPLMFDFFHKKGEFA
ncbi:MAG: alpha/beta hydrolase-fold protein [Defluviitaleaceae bacterium]|nr:alpha/beta hydrolase-fold protein [Defluviitaleaceae bacterium]MCL2276196.1 alpha/beta hydrolase-fold protein [Defluviitaleaceae bacterium]